MKDYHKLKQTDLSEQETDKLVGTLVKAKFDRNRRDRWTKQLAEKHRVSRDQVVSNKRPMRAPWFKTITIALAAAAALAFLLIARPFQADQKENLFALVQQHIEEEPFPNSLIRKGETPTAEELKYQLAQAYSQKQYGVAITLGQKLQTQGELNVWNLFYLSLSYLYQGQAVEAIQYFEMTRVQSAKENQEFKEEIQWFSALAHFEAGEELAAVSLLKEIKEGQWKYADAQQLLKVYNRFKD